MQLTLTPDKRTVTYRLIDVIFPSKTVSYTLSPEDWLERTEDSLQITFKDKTLVEVFLTHALSLEQREITREEVVKQVEH